MICYRISGNLNLLNGNAVDQLQIINRDAFY